MVDQDNKDKIESPEKPAVEQGTPEHIKAEVEKVPDKKEVLHDDPQVLAELRREMDLMLLEPGNEKAVEVEKEKLDYLGEKEKIEHLLQLAKEKDLVYAVHVAKSMGEPFILDLLHDTLAKDGYYKGYLKNRK